MTDNDVLSDPRDGHESLEHLVAEVLDLTVEVVDIEITDSVLEERLRRLHCRLEADYKIIGRLTIDRAWLPRDDEPDLTCEPPTSGVGPEIWTWAPESSDVPLVAVEAATAASCTQSLLGPADGRDNDRMQDDSDSAKRSLTPAVVVGAWNGSSVDEGSPAFVTELAAAAARALADCNEVANATRFAVPSSQVHGVPVDRQQGTSNLELFRETQARYGAYTSCPHDIGPDVTSVGRVLSYIRREFASSVTRPNIPAETSYGASGPIVTNVVQARDIRGPITIGGSLADVRPAQLPTPAAHYVNRERELGQLGRLLDTDTGQRTVVISGIGGVGKSALGVAWARSVAEQFPGGQLYVDMGSNKKRGAVSVGDVLAEFIRGLSFPKEWIPASLSERLELFRSLTRNQRLLVLIDDVDSAEQVTALTPPSNNAVVVVTSRWRMDALAMAGARFVMLEPFSPSEGAKLLAHRLGAERADQDPTALTELARLCGGLPVVLQAAAARLLTHSHWPVKRVVDELRQDGGVAVDEIIELSFRELSVSAAEVYLAAAVLPGADFTSEVLAAVVGRPVEADLESLVRASMMTESQHRRFTFPDVVGAHARRRAHRASRSTAEAVVQRATQWHASRAMAADYLIMGCRLRYGPQLTSQPFSSSAEALTWLVAERSALSAAVRMAAEAGWDDAIWQLADALWILFVHHDKYCDEFISSYHAAAAAAARVGQWVAEGTFRARLGRAYCELGEFDRADTELRRARAAARSARTAGLADGEQLEGMTADFTGLTEMRQGAYDMALHHFQRALALHEAMHNARGTALQSLNVGAALTALGRGQEALIMLRRAVDLLASDRRSQARTRITLGQALRAIGSVEEARRQFSEALTVVQELGVTSYQAQALDGLADLATDSADPSAEAQLRRQADEAWAHTVKGGCQRS